MCVPDYCGVCFTFKEMVMTGVNLAADNSELERAAWTSMDQAYGVKNGQGGYTYYPTKGDPLMAIDSSGGWKPQPWATPPGYVVQEVIEDAGMGGRFVIFKNASTNTVILTSMGTNGNDDNKGWLSNFLDTGRSQWVSGADGTSVRDRVLRALNQYISSETKLILAGDSKGGALSQFVVYDHVKFRDSGEYSI